jgi:hypothetical protein
LTSPVSLAGGEISALRPITISQPSRVKRSPSAMASAKDYAMGAIDDVDPSGWNTELETPA